MTSTATPRSPRPAVAASLQTIADDVSHGGNVFGVINVRYTDKGGPGGVPSLTAIEETQIRQRKQQVEHATSQSGTNVGNNTDEGGGEHRGSLGNGDWIRLNGPFNLVNIDSVTFRVADNDDDLTPGSPLAGVEIRTGAPDGPIVTTVNLTSAGEEDLWNSQTFPLSLSGLHDLYLVSRPIGGNNVYLLNYVEFNGKGSSVVTAPPVSGGVSGTVPATLSLSLGAPASFGAFTPGVARTYDASTTANVISSAGDATLSIADPSSNATGRLVNGSFSLPQSLRAKASSAAGTGADYAPVGGSASPTTLLSYAGPVSNDAVTLAFQQPIAANDALRTGSYSKVLTFTLSTTTP